MSEERSESSWGGLAAAAGAAGGAAAWIYGVGATVTSLRYEGFGLRGPEAIAVTPREELLFTGARSLAIWVLIGVAVTFAARRVDGAAAAALLRRLSSRPGLALLAAIIAVLLVVPHVIWPLALLPALLVVVKGAADWRAKPLLHVVAVAAAIAGAALAHELDRLHYDVDVGCVELTGGHADGPCGILFGQTDSGVYVAVAPQAGARDGRYTLHFVPAEQVRGATVRTVRRRVIDEFARSRREPPVERLFGIRVG